MRKIGLRSRSIFIPESLSKITNVCYVEVNDHDLRNVGNYLLEDGSQMFDIAIIFAANINFDSDKQVATLYCNHQVQEVLNNKKTHIKTLQKKGIKVLLSLLGNHCGTGVCNFPDQLTATRFAREVSGLVERFGLDGVDIDDEYAGYGQSGEHTTTLI